MFGAGTLSGLLGIGSGAVKVIAMDQAMSIPFKVSTTTSNFMIGVTAAASAGVYMARGYIDPGLAMPVMLGVVAGSLAGAHVLTHAKTGWLRIVFGVVIGLMGLEMIYHGLTGRLQRGRVTAEVDGCVRRAIDRKSLAGGVALASAVVLLGGIVYLYRHGLAAPQYRAFAGEPDELRSVSGILRGALTLRGRNIIQLGLLLLIMTPVARVAFAVAAFAAQRDRLYIGVTLLVLAILLFSLTHGQM